MATVTRVLCDICGSEKEVEKDVSVPVLVDCSANEYGSKKLPIETIETRKIDICEKCLRAITRVHEKPRWYQSPEYELTYAGDVNVNVKSLKQVVKDMDDYASTCDHYDKSAKPISLMNYAKRIREAIGEEA